MSSPSPSTDAAALRAEHDALAARLEIRRSVDLFRVGAYQAFAALIGVGLTIKLAWDRWGVLAPGAVRKPVTGPPLFFYAALVVAVVLLAFALRSFTRSRRLAREEDALFGRYRALREALRLDP